MVVGAFFVVGGFLACPYCGGGAWSETFELARSRATIHTQVMKSVSKPVAPTAGRASIKLLLVEDDPGAEHLVRKALTGPGSRAFEITHVAKLDDARKKLDAHYYHVMLLGLSSPNRRGLDTLKRARAAAPILPIVVMVGADDEALVLKAIQAGAQDYLIKGSADPRSLKRVVRHAIERQRILIDLGFSRAREHYLATHDLLTGLANRHLFEDHVNLALAHARRSGRMLAVLFFDIDHFKAINDRLGHAAGDELLRQFAKRLTACLRQDDAVARLSGDEFTVLQSDVSCPQDVGTVAQKALNAVAQPYLLMNAELSITASVGIAVYPADGEDADTLIKSADMAMYNAKGEGRNRYYSSACATDAAEPEGRGAIQPLRAPSQTGVSQGLGKA